MLNSSENPAALVSPNSAPLAARCLIRSALVFGSVLSAVSATRPLVGQESTDTIRLPEVVVTATRLSDQSGAAGASYTVLSGAALRARGIIFILDALREVPGAAVVQTGSFGGETSLFLRGGASNYVRVLIDGIPVNQPGGGVNFANFTTDNVDRIEIVRGPASVLYGSDAMSGVIQIFTRSGQGDVRGEGNVEAGTFRTQRYSLGVTGASKRVQLSATASSFFSDGTYAFNNQFRNLVASVQVASTLTSTLRGAFNFRFNHSRYHFPTDFGGTPVDHNQFSTDRGVVIGADLTQQLGRRFELEAIVGGSFSDLGFENQPEGPADTTGFGFAEHRIGRESRQTVEFRARRNAGHAFAITAGALIEAEHERNHDATTSNFGGGPTTEVNDFSADRTTRALYTEAAWNPGRILTLDIGLRLDDNTAFGRFGTYRLGALIGRGSAVRLRGSIGNAFKAPTFSEMFAQSAFEIGNRNLRPERATTWEVGADAFALAGHVTLSLVWFDQRFRDLIQYDFAGETRPSYENVAAALARGIEAQARLQAGTGLLVTAHFTHLETKVLDAGTSTSPAFIEGGRLLRRPNDYFGISGSMRIGRSTPLTVNLDGIGPRDDVDYRLATPARTTLPMRVVVDATVGREFPFLQGATLLGRVENLFDRRYQSVIGFPAPGRTVHVGLRASW